MEKFTSEKLASVMARILDDNKAKDIVILNVSNVCSLSDYFIIATGTSTSQIKYNTKRNRCHSSQITYYFFFISSILFKIS